MPLFAQGQGKDVFKGQGEKDFKARLDHGDTLGELEGPGAIDLDLGSQFFAESMDEETNEPVRRVTPLSGCERECWSRRRAWGGGAGGRGAARGRPARAGKCNAG